MTMLFMLCLLEPVRVGDIEIGVPKAETIRVLIRRPDRFPEFAGGSWLQIMLPLTNKNANRKAVCTQWLYTPKKARLTDDLDNEYKMYVLPEGAEFSWGIDKEFRIPNDDTAYACLIFEAPIPKATKLTLELSAENIGGKGKFKIVIPAAAWK